MADSHEVTLFTHKALSTQNMRHLRYFGLSSLSKSWTEESAQGKVWIVIKSWFNAASRYWTIPKRLFIIVKLLCYFDEVFWVFSRQTSQQQSWHLPLAASQLNELHSLRKLMVLGMTSTCLQVFVKWKWLPAASMVQKAIPHLGSPVWSRPLTPVQPSTE